MFKKMLFYGKQIFFTVLTKNCLESPNSEEEKVFFNYFFPIFLSKQKKLEHTDTPRGNKNILCVMDELDPSDHFW
jgi:hypothetical protein